MPNSIGYGTGNGRVRGGSDFAGNVVTAVQAGPDLHMFGVGTEVFANTTDESGGILAATTGASDDDNFVIRAGPFAPRDGLIKVSARFKYSNVDCAIFVGMSEVLDATTPVMPFEFATATAAYVAASGVLGIGYDVDGTTDDFRAVMADAGAAISDSGSGTRANATLTADRWFEAEVILYPDGSGECWLGDSGHANSDAINKLRLIKRFRTGTLLTTTDLFFVTLMIENRSANSRVMEVDYFFYEAGRDWRWS